MITGAQRELLATFLAEVYRWNGRVNLTSVPESQAWERHVGESVRLLEAASPPAGARAVDVGSGLGVPGVPIAVLRPDIAWTLLESDRRKAGFLTHVAGLLGLANVRIAAVRAEVLGRQPGAREGFDVAVSRATAAAPVLCELALPLLRVGGYLAALVAGAEVARADGAHAAAVCGGGAPEVWAPGVIVVRKVGATPDAYPRRAGAPGRHPLTGR